MKKKINITPERCPWHKTVKNGYIEWHTWADEQDKKGIKQSVCYDCGRWLYPEEMGKKPEL